MPSLYITEHEFLAAGDNGAIMSVALPPITTQKLAVGVEVKSAPFSPLTRYIRLALDSSACSIQVGPNPTATVADMRLDIYEDPIFAVQPGDRLSVIVSDVP